MLFFAVFAAAYNACRMKLGKGAIYIFTSGLRSYLVWSSDRQDIVIVYVIGKNKKKSPYRVGDRIHATDRLWNESIR